MVVGRGGANLSRSPAPPVLVFGAVLASIAAGGAAGFNPWAGLVILLGAAYALLVVSRPTAAIFVLVTAAPLTSGLRRGFPVPGFRLSEILTILTGGLLLISLHSRQAVRWRAVDWWLAAYTIGSLLIGLAAAAIDGRTGTLDFNPLVGPLQFLLLYRSVISGARSQETRRTSLRLIFGGSVIVSVLAVLQQLDVPGVRDFIAYITGGSVFKTWSYDKFPRATGVFPHWHPLAGYLLIIILLLFAFLLDPEQKVVARPVLAVILGVDMLALVCSVSLTVFFAVAAGALLLGVWYRRLGRILGLLATGAAVSLLLFSSLLSARLESQYSGGSSGAVPQTIGYRFQVWQDEYLPAMAGHWIFGYGTGDVPGITWLHTENLYLTLLLRGGVLLLLVYAALMIALVQRSIRLLDVPEPERRAVVRVLLAVTVILVPINAIFPYLTASGMPQLFWLLPAFAFAPWPAGHPHSRRFNKSPQPLGRFARTDRRRRYYEQTAGGEHPASP
jgi:O-antigen ligase